MSPIEVVAAFAGLAGQIDGVAVALDHEPEKISDQPAVTVAYRHVLPKIIDVAIREEQTWTFRVYVYAQLTTYRDAQMKILELVPGLLRITQTNRTLNNTCIDSRMDDEGREPTPNHREGYLTKTLSLTFKTLVAL